MAELLREYLRIQAAASNQSRFAAQLGFKRQTVNAILNGAKGRDVRHKHIDALAKVRGVSLSSVLRELANLAWTMEENAFSPAVAVELPQDVAPGGYVDPATAEELGLSPPAPSATSAGRKGSKRGRRPR